MPLAYPDYAGSSKAGFFATDFTEYTIIRLKGKLVIKFCHMRPCI